MTLPSIIEGSVKKMSSPFEKIFSKRVVTLDGGLGTELEDRKVNIEGSLWSSVVLLENPEAVTNVHYDYYKSGADVAITCSYQASSESLKQFDKKFSTLEARQAVWQRSVDVAVAAKDKFPSENKKVSASIGPYGAFLCDGSEFTGDYRSETSEKFYQDFHRERVNFFNENADIDYLSLETMPNIFEIRALVKLVESLKSTKPYIVSLSIRDAGHLADGTTLDEFVKSLAEIGALSGGRLLAVGGNCLKLKYSAAFVKNLQAALVANGYSDFPICIYPNSGEVYDGLTKTWRWDESMLDVAWADLVPKYIENGARMIGGCCRVGPKDIGEMYEAIQKAVHEQKV